MNTLNTAQHIDADTALDFTDDSTMTLRRDAAGRPTRKGTRGKLGRVLACCALGVWLSGCQSMIPQSATEDLRPGIQSLLDRALEAETARLAALPPIDAAPVIVAPSEPTFNVQVINAPLRGVLEGLVADTSYSLVLDPDLTGQISLNLKEVTVPEAVEVICRLRDLDCQTMRTGFMIFPKRLAAQVFQIHYPDMNRSGRSTTRVTSGQVDQNQGTAPANQSDAEASDTSSGTRLETSFQSDFWREMTAVVCSSLGLPMGLGRNQEAGGAGGHATADAEAPTVSEMGPGYFCGVSGGEEGRSVSVSPQTGLVAIRAYPLELHRIANLLERMRANLSRQVVLEAKIVEVELSSGFQNGINWSVLASVNGQNTIGVGQTGGGALNEAMTQPSDLFGAVAGTFASGLPYSAFGGIFGASFALGDFEGFLELLSSQGSVHVLSSPRISTLNSQKAVIKVGVDDYFVTDVRVSYTDGVTTVSPTFTPFFSGVALDVTPRLGENDEVTLHIHPSVSVVTQSLKTVNGLEYPLALNSVRESDSIVTAQSGEIVVIGGLMKEEFSNSRAQVPLLGDLPVLGNLFSQNRDASVKTELVILVRPTIIPAAPIRITAGERS